VHDTQAIQLPLLPLSCDPGQDPADIAGCWSAGERLVRLRGAPAWVNVWFHFFEGGEAILSLRYQDEAPPCRVHGRWWLEGPALVVSFGGGGIRASCSWRDDLLHWGDQVLVRVPDRTASLPFGIEMPYRQVRPDAPLPELQ